MKKQCNFSKGITVYQIANLRSHSFPFFSFFVFGLLLLYFNHFVLVNHWNLLNIYGFIYVLFANLVPSIGRGVFCMLCKCSYPKCSNTSSLLKNSFLCVCIYEYTGSGVDTYEHIKSHLCGDPFKMLNIFLNISPPYILRKCLSPQLELTDWFQQVWVTSSGDFLISLSPVLGLMVCITQPTFI